MTMCWHRRFDAAEPGVVPTDDERTLDVGPSALDRSRQAADDATLEETEEDQRRDHRQRRERQDLGGVDRVLRRERLHAQRQGKRVLVVEDEQRQQVVVPAPDEGQDPYRDDARDRQWHHHAEEESSAWWCHCRSRASSR